MLLLPHSFPFWNSFRHIWVFNSIFHISHWLSYISFEISSCILSSPSNLLILALVYFDMLCWILQLWQQYFSFLEYISVFKSAYSVFTMSSSDMSSVDSFMSLNVFETTYFEIVHDPLFRPVFLKLAPWYHAQWSKNEEVWSTNNSNVGK